MTTTDEVEADKPKVDKANDKKPDSSQTVDAKG